VRRNSSSAEKEAKQAFSTDSEAELELSVESETGQELSTESETEQELSRESEMEQELSTEGGVRCKQSAAFSPPRSEKLVWVRLPLMQGTCLGAEKKVWERCSPRTARHREA
jgi:hypothetical protein